MGEVGRRKDIKQKEGTTAETMADLGGTKSTHPVEKTGDPTLQGVLQAITVSREALEGKLDALATDLTILRDDHCRLAEKVYTTEKQVKEFLPEIKDTSKITQNDGKANP
ncbi:hypothetical protein NDU88_005956 [Pleurodeles waltl]|uniref:Uncharacterized protein n=1 Tax=Pleurodeles waltl TaxID=8319 RepID=A0AAV7QGB3_PLEWA|nr:hypothetical protein NDU88_005956 [Pleurodeles waltl]